MNARTQLSVLIAVLIFVGISLAVYKYHVLGFTLTPGGTETVWQIEGRIQFQAKGGPAKVIFLLPSTVQQRKVLLRQNISKDYEYNFIEQEGSRKAVWTRSDARGAQTIYFRGDFYNLGLPQFGLPRADARPEVLLEGALKAAGQELLLKARVEATSDLALALKVLELMDEENKNPNVAVLMEEVRYRHERLEQVVRVLAIDGIHARVVRGLRLEGEYTQRSITSFIRVFARGEWVLLEQKSLSEIPFHEVVLWPEGTQSILDVYGGTKSRVDLSVSSIQKRSDRLAVESAQLSENALIDFSIYSLPIREQNTFKLLLLIPFGALVVVILRNLVGIRTSGTFMPILIALTFMQTTLLTGLLLFLVVVSVGLIMRSYLSALNLLLVPRIAAVLVFVIVIFAAIGIASHKLGWESGLAITFFPMIILSWTIERMSVLWEEEGPREVLIQGGGSLLTASLAYLLMVNANVAHLAFNFPELLLVLLGIILMIGSYSGFRLLELGRFEPMTRDQ
jgi:hypothetical protein